MHCVICGCSIQKPEPARHLPHFVRCPNCTGYVTAEAATPAYPETYFTEEALDKNKRSIFSPLLDFFLWLRLRKIRKLLPKDTPLTPPSKEGGRGKVLDYGCGNGKLVAYLRHRGLLVDGYDPSAGAVALAKKQGLPVFGAIPEGSYELIMLWHSLEHSEQPLADIRALTKYLLPNGRLLIAVPNGGSLQAKVFGESFFCYDWPFHRVHFTPKALSTLLQKAGFRILQTDYVNPEYTLSSLAQTLLNLFLPKNALYSLVSARRSAVVRYRLPLYGVLSAFLLLVCSPFLLLFFVTELITGQTAAFITVAELS